jgi:hypothetical protein
VSIQAVAWALEQRLPPKPKLVLVSIANHANHVDGYCWLALETIEREASIPTRSLFRYIGALVRNGYLRKQLRKGDDGKQRSTDYWILFGRESQAWEWGQKVPEDDDDGDTQDVVEPSATESDGNARLADGDFTADTPVLADGPSAIVGRAYNAEPSESKPSKEEESPPFDPAEQPRAYQPPPIEPMGAIIDQKAKQIFVIEGTRAWKAWVAFKTRECGRRWNLVTSATVNGRIKRGWYFPSLFPPGHVEPVGLSDADAAAFANG